MVSAIKQKSVQRNNFLRIATICLLALPSLSFAVSNSNLIPTNSSSTRSRKPGPFSDFSLESSFEFSQSIAEGEQTQKDETMDISLAPAYKINDSLKAQLRIILSKDNSGCQETQSSDTVLSLAVKGVQLAPDVTTLHTVSAVLPTSEKSRDQDRLQSAFGISNGLHFAGSVISATYRLGYTHYIHEFNLNADGTPNVQQSFSHTLGLQLKVTDKFYITTLGIYRWGLTYGQKERSSFEVHGDLNYDVTDKMTLNVGTSNAGQALKANGVDSNITAYDEDSSIFRAGISISL